VIPVRHFARGIDNPIRLSQLTDDKLDTVDTRNCGKGGQMKRDWQSEITGREITAETLQHTEEQFRILVESVHDYAIYMLNKDGVVITWNSGAQRIKGYHPDEIVGKHFSCFYQPEDIKAGKPNRSLQRAAAEGRYQEESLRVRKDGSIFWASVVITALYNTEGQLDRFAKVVRDITERKETEQLLRERDRLAILGTTAAVFAHEIGNPLNGLSTSLQVLSQMLQGSSQDPLLLETLDLSLQELQRLTALLNDYRAFARPQSVAVQPADLRQIFDEVLAPTIKYYNQRGIKVELEFDQDLPLIPVDPEKIKQVILNLCKNAVEAMPDGGILTCKGYQKANRMILEVVDTGTGVLEDFEVFQLFKTTKPEGTGLGLPIVEQIVSEHGGTVNYISELGKGTAFIVSLPLGVIRD
jgi:PAS domain S-box-containing protein